MDHFVLVPEELLTHLTTWAMKPIDELIRADMVYFDVPGGGAVFSVSSITFCGSLPWNGDDNNISQVVIQACQSAVKPEIAATEVDQVGNVHALIDAVHQK